MAITGMNPYKSKPPALWVGLWRPTLGLNAVCCPLFVPPLTDVTLHCPVLVLTSSEYPTAVCFCRLGSFLNVNVFMVTENIYIRVNCSFSVITWGCGRTLLKSEWGQWQEAGFTTMLTPLSSARAGALARPPVQLPKRVGLAESYLPRFDFMCVDLLKDARRLGKTNTFLHSILIHTKFPTFSWGCFGFEGLWEPCKRLIWLLIWTFCCILNVIFYSLGHFSFFLWQLLYSCGLSACPQLKNFLLGWGRECWLISWATTSFSGELLYVILRNCYCEFIIGIELRYYSKTLVNIYCIFKLLYVVTEFTLMYKIFLHLVGRSNDINLTCFW